MENSVDSGPASSNPTHRMAFKNVGTHLGTNQALDLHHGSVSSPDLQLQIKPPAPDVGISRTKTLPLRSPKRISSGAPTLQEVTFDAEHVERLRLWVLGLAIGNCYSLVQPCTLYAYSFNFSRF